MTQQRLRIKRVYRAPDTEDGVRVLVDRLWPRGLSRERAQIDLWLKEIAPSDALRRRFHGDPAGWVDFKTAYYAELEQQPAQSAVLEARSAEPRARHPAIRRPRRDQNNNCQRSGSKGGPVSHLGRSGVVQAILCSGRAKMWGTGIHPTSFTRPR
jgi:uncharacterized protein YeaO (DUF488 family)